MRRALVWASEAQLESNAQSEESVKLYILCVDTKAYEK
jgi:hypothetical protein